MGGKGEVHIEVTSELLNLSGPGLSVILKQSLKGRLLLIKELQGSELGLFGIPPGLVDALLVGYELKSGTENKISNETLELDIF